MERMNSACARLLTPALAALLSHSPVAVNASSPTIRFPEVLFLANSAEPIADSSFYFLDDPLINTMDEVIADMAMIMRENPTITLELTGHTDVGEPEPEALALRRARYVGCMLTSVHGIDPGRLIAVAHVTEGPRIGVDEITNMKNDIERGHARQLNRYVSFRITRFDWSPPLYDELAAVRFLSDPVPPTQHEQNFCDEPMHASVEDLLPVPDAEEDIVQETATAQTEDADVLPPTTEAVVPTDPAPSALQELAPMILTDPVQDDELTIVWLPSEAELVTAEILALDGRSICRKTSANVRTGTRLQVRLPSQLSSGTYLVMLTSGERIWSVRFVRP
jgi:hypothetical protein